MRVAETERAEHGAPMRNGYDERGCRCEAAVEIGDPSGSQSLARFGTDLRPQHRASRPDHLRHGAVGVVRTDPVDLHQRLYHAAARSRRVRSGHTADRATAGEMHETEVCQGRDSGTRRPVDRATRRVDRGARQGSGDRQDLVHMIRVNLPIALEVGPM